MFGSYKTYHEGFARRVVPPVEVKEEETANAEKFYKKFYPPDGFVKSRKRKTPEGIRIDDASILAELAWEARDVADPNCPRSRRELRHRLGITKRKSLNQEATYNDYGNESSAAPNRTLDIEGIGISCLSDESPGGIPSSCESSSECSSCSESSFSKDGTKEEKNNYQRKKKIEISSKDDIFRNDDDVSHEIISRKRNQKNVVNLKKTISLNTPAPRRLPSTAALRSPYKLAIELLRHLVLSTLERHEFRDALQLMSLFLLEAYRPQPCEIPLRLFRLYSKFCGMIHEFRFSDFHIDLLRSCYGQPAVLVRRYLHNTLQILLIIAICSLFCDFPIHYYITKYIV